MEEKLDGTWKVTQGPYLPKHLFGHCAIVLPGGNILLSGGFDGIDQSDISQEFHWEDDVNGKWIKKPWSSMKTKRYDHLCILQNGVVHAIGGWKENIDPHMEIERYNTTLMTWEIASDTQRDELPDILRSSSLGYSEGKLALIGGVSCITGINVGNGKKCLKHQDVYEFESQIGWKKLNNTIQTPRSGHVGITIPVSMEGNCKGTRHHN